MDALVICGGRGTRLDADVEKPLFPVGGEPMVDRVVAALDDSSAGSVRALTSPHAPATRDHLTGHPAVSGVLDGPGEGYVADLQWAVERLDGPVLTVAADLPLLDGPVVDRVLWAHVEGSLTVAVPVALKRRLGLGVDTSYGADPERAPTGVNVVGEGGETERLIADPRLAVNVNRRRDAAVAEALLEEVPGRGP